MKKEIGYIYIQVLFLGKSSHIRFCNTELRVQYMWFWVNMFRFRDLIELEILNSSHQLLYFCFTD